MSKNSRSNTNPVISPVQTADSEPKRTIGSSLPLVTKLCLILFVLSCLVYGNTIGNDYVFDDSMMIGNNHYVTQGIKGIPTLFTTPHLRGIYIVKNDLYRPLSLVMFAIEYQIWGLNPLPGHVINILLFGLCVVLLFVFLNKLFDGRKAAVAFIAALLFAVHPIHTEVAANIKSGDELLCFLFAFLSLILFMEYMNNGRKWLLLIGSFTLFISYISKETVVAFLGIVPVIFFFYYNKDKKRAVHITMGTIAATVLFLAIRMYVLNKYDANQHIPVTFIENSLINVPTMTRLGTTLLILGKYLMLMFMPYPLLCDYAYNSIPFTGFNNVWVWISLLAYGALMFVMIKRWLKQKSDPWALAIFFYLATLFLFSNILFLVSGELAERFTFFASVGFCLAAGLAIERWIIKVKDAEFKALKNIKVLTLLIPVLIIFCSLTVARNRDWKDSFTLFRTDLEKSPNDSRLQHHFGVTLLDSIAKSGNDTILSRQLTEESIVHFKKALEIYPEFEEAMTSLSHSFSRERKYDSAERYMLMALARTPRNPSALNDLGYVYFNSERYDKALICFKKFAAIGTKLDSQFSFYSQGRTFTKLKEYDSTIFYCSKTLAINPRFADAHFEIAEAFDRLQKADSAEVHYKINADLFPDNANTRNNLGMFYFYQKRYGDAIEQFKKTIGIDPNYVNAYSNLGVSYFLTNQYEAAISAFNKELSLDPHNGADMPYMAIAYQRLGNMELALRYEGLVKQFNPGFKLEPMSDTTRHNR